MAANSPPPACARRDAPSVAHSSAHAQRAARGRAWGARPPTRRRPRARAATRL